MVLEDKTKEKIINIRDYYEKRNKIFDVNFMDEILVSLQKDEGFQDTLEYEFINTKKYGVAFALNGKASFNMEVLIPYIIMYVKANFKDYSQTDVIKYYNLMALHIILHECGHVWQQNGLEKYAEINRLHNDIYLIKTFPLKDILKSIRYNINMLRINSHAYFERQANIDALRELREMYKDSNFVDFIELLHIANLGFKPKGKSIVHDTLKLNLSEYNYDCTGIPKNLLFEVGLPIEDKRYTDEVYRAIDKYYDNELTYKKVLKKVNKI